MANSRIPNVNLSDTMNSHRTRFNQLLDSVGDVSTLTTTATDVTSAINEHDAELGTITAGAMGTTASTVSTAIAELDGRLDSINTTELLSPRATLSDSDATNIVRGNLQVDTDLHVGGNTTMSGTLTVDGQVTFKAGSNNNISLGDAATDTITLTGEVNSNIIPDGDNTYDLGSSTKEWRHVYVDGTVNADNVAADSATIANNVSIGGNTTLSGTLDVDGATTLDAVTIDSDLTVNGITSLDSATVDGDLSVTRNLDVAGITNLDSATVDGPLDVTGNLDVGGITDLDSTNIVGPLDVTGDVTITGAITSTGTAFTITAENGTADPVTLGDTITFSAGVGIETTVSDNQIEIAGEDASSSNKGVAKFDADDFTVTSGNVTLGNSANGAVLTINGTTNEVTATRSNGTVTVGLPDNVTIDSDLTVTGHATIGVNNIPDVTNINHALVVDSNLTVHGISNLDSTNFVGAVDVTGSLNVSSGFTVGGTFTTTGTTRNASTHVIVNDGVAVGNSNRAGLAVDRPSTDSAVIQWNEQGDYWEAGTTTDLGRLALQGDSATFTNIYQTGTGATRIPSGTTAQRPTARRGQIRYNTSLKSFEGYDGTYWGTLGGLIDNDRDTYIVAERIAASDSDTLQFYAGGSSVANLSSSNFTVNTDLTVNDSAYVTGNLQVGGILKVDQIKSSTPGEQVYINDTLELAANNINDVANIYLRDKLYHDGDTNTYLGFGTDNIKLRTGGTDRVEINNNEVILSENLKVNDSAYVTGNLQVGGNTVLEGNLTVKGTTTTVNSTTVALGDNIILLNDSLSSESFANVNDAGIEIERGTSTNVQLLWDESEDYWVAATDGSNTLSRIATANWLNVTNALTYDASTGKLGHADTSSVADVSSDNSGNTFIQDISATYDSYGHATGFSVSTGTVSIPTYDNYVSWNIRDSQNTSYGITSGDTLSIDGDGSHINTDFSADDVLKISHRDVTRTDTTSTSETLGYSGTFEVVDSIQTNNQGHVTRVATKSFTLPASDNTDTNTTYDLSVPASTTAIRLAGSDTTNDDITITGGTNVTVTRNSATQLTISSTDTNTDTLQSIAANSTNSNQYITFVPNTTGAQTGRVDAGLRYNPSTNTLDVPNITDVNLLQADDANPMYFKNDQGYYNFQASTSSTTSRPQYIQIINTDTATSDDQSIGGINFATGNNAGVDKNYVKIIADTGDVTQTLEDGHFKIAVLSNDSDLIPFESRGYGHTSIRATANVKMHPGTSQVEIVGLNGQSMIHDVTGANWQRVDASHELILRSGNSNRITLDTSLGQIDLDHNGSQDIRLDIATTDTLKLYTGTTTLNSTWSGDDLTVQGDITSVSDVRTKENIETVENSLDLVSQLRGVWYNKIGEDERKVGVIAQEVEEVLPEVVHTDVEGMKAVDYGKMVGVLIEAIKELKAEIEELKGN